MDLKLSLNKDSNISFFNAQVVTLDLEDYISGCVAQEIGNAHIEACKAQAIAARTNCQPYIKNNNNISDKSSSFQAFEASKMNNPSYPNPRKAAQETKSIVLTYNGKVAIPASFSANNGGKITSSKERWGGDRGWLISKEDPYDIGNKTGHGVGLSQRGAKKMAELGFDYKEILEFYFPGTELAIMQEDGSVQPMAMKTKAEIVKSWALSKQGCGYVWGATGEKLTQEYLQRLLTSFSEHIDEEVVSKWMGKEVYDCAYFTKAAMKQVGITIGSGASSQWRKSKWEQKGKINTLPVNKVCILYRESPNADPMQHTGVYLGDGTVVDARGSKTGVIHSNLTSYGWTHWAIPQGLYDQNENSLQQEVLPVLYEATVTATTGNTVRMRAEATTDSPVLKNIKLGQVVDVVEEVNDDWRKIVFNGQTGFMMKKFLAPMQAPVTAPSTWYVKIECGSEADARAIAAALKLCGNTSVAQA